MKKLLLVPLFALMSTSAFAKVCKDDPRLFTIKTVIEKMEAGETVKPLKLTPQTFLDMPYLVRNKLGDNIRVYDNQCVPNQVYQGTLPKSIEMPFYALENSMQKSLMRNDKKMADVIVNQFIASPMTTDEVLPLIASLPWTDSAIKNLHSYKYIKEVAQENTYLKHQKYCNHAVAKPTLLDIYGLLNGKVTDKSITAFGHYETHLVVVTESGYTQQNSSEVEKVLMLGTTDDYNKCSGISIGKTSNTLANIGVNLFVVNSDNESFLHEKLLKAKMTRDAQ
jgi:hypothetical protein